MWNCFVTIRILFYPPIPDTNISSDKLNSKANKKCSQREKTTSATNFSPTYRWWQPGPMSNLFVALRKSWKSWFFCQILASILKSCFRQFWKNFEKIVSYVTLEMARVSGVSQRVAFRFRFFWHQTKHTTRPTGKTPQKTHKNPAKQVGRFFTNSNFLQLACLFVFPRPHENQNHSKLMKSIGVIFCAFFLWKDENENKHNRHLAKSHQNKKAPIAYKEIRKYSRSTDLLIRKLPYGKIFPRIYLTVLPFSLFLKKIKGKRKFSNTKIEEKSHFNDCAEKSCMRIWAKLTFECNDPQMGQIF